MAVSPANMNVCCEVLAELLPLVALELEELDGRSRVQGIGTSFSPVDGVAEDEALLVEPLAVRLITAKSTLPDVGFRMTSLMVPRVSPDDPWTLAPMSLLALSS